MRLDDIEVGDIVATTITLTMGTYGANVPRGTSGIVTAINERGVYVEFELDGRRSTNAVPCSAIFLRPGD